MSKRKHKRRTDKLARYISPSLRFWTGMALIPPYFMVDSLMNKAVLILLFALMATWAGKKIRIFYFVFLVSSITFFHLLTPVGRILMTLGPLKITSGALATGLAKGLTLCGLVFLSLFSVTPALKLPGRMGGLLARTFYYFEEILNGRRRISARDFIGSLDTVLLDLFPPDRMDDLPPEAAVHNPVSPLIPVLYVAFLITAVWGSLAWQILM